MLIIYDNIGDQNDMKKVKKKESVSNGAIDKGTKRGWRTHTMIRLINDALRDQILKVPLDLISLKGRIDLLNIGTLR